MRLGGLYDTVVEKNIPFFSGLEITTECNNRCVHCYNVGDHTMPLDVAKKCMDGMAELGTLFLSITGGEPLLHRNIWDILSYAVGLDFAVLLYTNATLIGEKEAVRLKEMGIYHVDTSLLGARKETHDALTGVEGSFDRTMRALKALRDLDISMAVKTPVMKENAGEVDEMREMLEGMGINHIASPIIFARDDGDPAPLCHRPTDEQLTDYFLRRNVRTLNDCNGAYSCHFGRCTFAVRASGEVNPCIAVPLSLGNVRERSLKEIWTRNDELDNIRDKGQRPIPECADCSLVGWCFRCEGISFTEEGRLFAPSKELCRMARIRKEASDGEKREPGKEEKVHQAGNRAC